MHICIVIDSMYGGGAEFSCLLYARALIERGHKVDLVLVEFHGQRIADIPNAASLFTLDYQFRRKKDELSLISLDEVRWIRPQSTISSFIRYIKALRIPKSGRLKPRLRHFLWSTAMAQYIDSEQPDLIYANLFHAGAISILGRTMASKKVPIVWAARNHTQSVLNQENFRQYCSLAPFADAIQANSMGVAQSEQSIVPLNENKVVTVYNPVNPNIAKLAAQTPDQLTEWFSCQSNSDSETPDKTYLILAVGRLVKQKNFSMLIHAFSEVVKSTNARLAILGEGPERHSLETEARSLRIEKHLLMPGWVPNPYAYMSRSDLFVLSSNHEGFPNALVEALACGCPVVSTDCPHGPSEILENGKWGILTPVDNYIAMSKAIIRSLNQKPNRQKLQERVTEFSVAGSVDKLEDLFQNVISDYNAKNP